MKVKKVREPKPYKARKFGEGGNVLEVARPGTMKWVVFEYCIGKGVPFSINQLEIEMAMSGGPMKFFTDQLGFEWRDYSRYISFHAIVRNFRLKAERRNREKKVAPSDREYRVMKRRGTTISMILKDFFHRRGKKFTPRNLVRAATNMGGTTALADYLGLGLKRRRYLSPMVSRARKVVAITKEKG
jgi:hypothetical protein